MTTPTRPVPALRRRIRPAVSAAFALAVAFGAGAHAAERSLPALHLTKAQTAQLNISLNTPPDPVKEACIARIGFVDASGEVFRTRSGVPVSVDVELMPGETRSLSLSGAVAFGSSKQLRKVFRPTARFANPPDPVTPDPCAAVQVTVEVYDNTTGRTAFGLANPPEPVTPQR